MSTDLVRVIAAVISQGEKLLVCQRPLTKRHGGLWEFPGGKRQPGESDAQAAARELREELGVDVEEVGKELFAAHDDGAPYLIAFLPVTIAGQPACREHMALRWELPKDIAQLPLAPSDRRFVSWCLTRQ